MGAAWVVWAVLPQPRRCRGADSWDRTGVVAFQKHRRGHGGSSYRGKRTRLWQCFHRSEEHTSELQSPCNLVCRLLLEKQKERCVREHLTVTYGRAPCTIYPVSVL